MSRLEAGALALAIQPIDVADVISAALTSLGPAASEVIIRVPEETPEMQADPGLLEGAVANLVQNALRFSSPGTPPQIMAGAYCAAVKSRVIDRGQGAPETDWDHIFQPSQRFGDRVNPSGVGLDLVLSRGLVEPMSGIPSPEETPGGSLTITISLPAAAELDRHADFVEPHRQSASSTASRAATASERP
jgi:two-component system sensor histidine kinase KdpD